MSNTTVHVKNISSQTSEKEVRDFFSFCGKISSISVNHEGTSQSAAVIFEKPTAAKTALLLDNTQLGSSLVQVTAASTIDEMSSEKNVGGSPSASAQQSDEVDQEDKPRSRIIAEYLAQGYTVSDQVISRAIDLDNQHGYSARFTGALQSFDNKYHASDKANQLDQKLGVTEKAAAGWHGISSYFEKALGTPSGQRVRDFYQAGNKQVLDVHNEARRLADMKSGKAGSSSTEEKAGMEKLPGSERTKCNCGGDTGHCPCEPGKCACASCHKNPQANETMM